MCCGHDRPYRLGVPVSSDLPVAKARTLPVLVKSEPDLIRVGPIQSFVNSGIQQSIQAAIAKLPEGKSGAVIPYANKDSINIAIVGRVSDNLGWTVVVTKPWKGDVDFEAGAMYSW